jgi:hypothetical protein
MGNKNASRSLLTLVLALAMAVPFLTSIRSTRADAPLTGAIFTTNGACTGRNVNIFASKDDVYVDGGPAHTGAAGLPPGSYCIRVTAPDGTVLGKSSGPVITVNSAGEFDMCYQLSAYVFSASSSFIAPGYDDTPNPGGEYKVWVTLDCENYAESLSKTDNFKVKSDGGVTPQGTLKVIKFYDVDADGVLDPEDIPIAGWEVRIQDGIDFLRFTPVEIVVEPDTYTVTECSPDALNWRNTTATSQTAVVVDGGTTTVRFGNVCLGAGGGLTLGFWSNKNGAKRITGPPSLLAGVLALCLRNADGSLLGSVNLANFQKFLLNATATNMANMLSAQLAAMNLNVASGGVNGTSIIYAPGTNSANAFGFASVNAVMTEADTLLCSGGATLLILSGNPDRPRAEALKNALDNANNNLNFVQATPCDTPVSFTCSTN